MSAKFPKEGSGFGEHDLSKLVVKNMCNDSTGCDEVDSYFARDEDTMIDIAYEEDLDEF